MRERLIAEGLLTPGTEVLPFYRDAMKEDAFTHPYTTGPMGRPIIVDPAFRPFMSIENVTKYRASLIKQGLLKPGLPRPARIIPTINPNAGKVIIREAALH